MAKAGQPPLPFVPTPMTVELFRKRSEHNDGNLLTLKEITLHQYDIERIDKLLGRECPDLEIIFLQNNVIAKIENLERIQNLQYLNLGINNIRRFEGLANCEFLHKLDMTLNFIDDLLSIEHLRPLDRLRELFLTGNPCCKYTRWREFVIATLPQLTRLDSHDIEHSQRIVACQDLEEIRRVIAAEQAVAIPANTARYEQLRQLRLRGELDLDAPMSDSPEARIASRMKIQQEEAAKEAAKKAKEEADHSAARAERLARVRNQNEARLEFFLEETRTHYNLDLEVGKFVDSSLIKVDVLPTYVTVLVKGKIFRLVLNEEVQSDSSTAQRSQVTGRLLISMPKVKAILQPTRPPETKSKASATSSSTTSTVSTSTTTTTPRAVCTPLFNAPPPAHAVAPVLPPEIACQLDYAESDVPPLN